MQAAKIVGAAPFAVAPDDAVSAPHDAAAGGCVMRDSYETLLVEKHDDKLLVVTLNRPQVSNAINTQMGHDLLDLFTALVAEPEQARCVVLTGAGTKAFC